MIGVHNSNTCPDGSEKMQTSAACSTAATNYGKTFNRQDSWTNYPGGCFWNHNEQFYFNTHTGAGTSLAKPLCSTETGL